MDDEMLEDYLDRAVRIHFAPGMIGAGLSPYVDGKLYDYNPSGILLEESDGSLDYIPFSSIRLVQIRPKPGLWARLTGSA
ncbi:MULTISPECIES: hypothetical protein [Brevibacillus]|jgi:hypothetical protein|uniref:Uncharacterized protein n=1 Tax=Brevibacillus nitrificans TaxID=651560 RepID=A0A3M8DLR3_9BACL|nr:MULTISPECIES: hypothetical protein [Brevibacillus]MEC2128354.1 hypothetical protein [Brevibacillus centrosporus]MED1794315.1 hypothetical protein [Brevibacillus nitrificans]MED1949073.1 hypothetical protein [Brevibacillus centrosporus]RNB73796.1 hypothetical protein EDM55_02100 [Brevibacillus centrosporus]RNB88027.1 hypothetical protein EDM59_02550 [Brevibacillus nitrificans]